MDTRLWNLGVYTLAPPYTTCSPLGSELPELGSIVVADVRVGRTTCETLAAVATRAPWCLSCALVPASMTARELIDLLDLLPPGCFKLPVENDSNPFDPDRFTAAVTQREGPAPSEIARYVAGRTSPGIASPVLSCLARNGVERISRSYLSRRLKAYPPYTAHDWAAIGDLILILRSGRWPAGRMARENGLDPRTLRAWSRRYLGMSWSAAEQLLGWESIVEAALRQGGYVTSPSAHISAEQSALGA